MTNWHWTITFKLYTRNGGHFVHQVDEPLLRKSSKVLKSKKCFLVNLFSHHCAYFWFKNSKCKWSYTLLYPREARTQGLSSWILDGSFLFFAVISRHHVVSNFYFGLSVNWHRSGRLDLACWGVATLLAHYPIYIHIYDQSLDLNVLYKTQTCSW